MPSFHQAMKGYITLSRLKTAHKLLLVQPFNPLLFKQGPRPHPTLLLSVLQNQLPDDGLSLAARCELIRGTMSSREQRKLTTCTWICNECGLAKRASEYAIWKEDELYDVIMQEVIAPGSRPAQRMSSFLYESSFATVT